MCIKYRDDKRSEVRFSPEEGSRKVYVSLRACITLFYIFIYLYNFLRLFLRLALNVINFSRKMRCVRKMRDTRYRCFDLEWTLDPFSKIRLIYTNVSPHRD